MVLELPDLNAMMGKGEVDEADAGKVEVGQVFRIRLDAHPDLEYTGTVGSIWQTVQQKSWRNPVKVVRLDLELDEPDPMRMRPGMRFRGKVETGRIPDALLIPAAAVFPSADGPTVYRKTLLGHERIGVTLGERNDEYVQVLDGLDEGDRVAERDPEPGERA
jgi:HlyD family secretion protein